MKICLSWILVFYIFTPDTKGQVIWDDESGDGLWSTSKNWSGDVLPDGNSNVEINGSYFVTVDVNTTVNSVALYGEARLLIDDGRQLTLTGIKDQAMLIDKSLLEIKGTLYIDLYLGDGIKNVNAGNIENHGHIIVDLVSGDGIWNEAGINNNNYILIDSTQENGIVNSGAAANFINNDSIKLFRIAEIGFKNQSGATFTNNIIGSRLVLEYIYGIRALVNSSSTFLNHGALQINATSSTGMYISGTNGIFENHYIIHISNVLGGSSISNGFGSTTINKPNGLIAIEQCNNGVNNSMEGTWINEGSITIKNVSIGLSNNSCFMNKDSICIDSSQIGIQNVDSTFSNMSTGVVEMFHITGTSPSWAIYNLRNFENYGAIRLTDVHTGIRNHTSISHFDNFHNLHISEVSIYGIWNTNGGSLINHPSANIDIFDSRIAVRNEFVTSALINQGIIGVDGTTEMGIFCTESTSLINELGGEISVTNTVEGPISIASPATLDNNGLLDLE